MSSSREAESGDALRIRVSARTASLNQIALAGAEGLQTALRTIAQWMGANPAEAKVTPNLDFVDEQMDGQALVSLMTAKSLGAPLSKRTIHDRMREQEITALTFEEEMEEIESEEPEPTGGGDTEEPVDDTQRTGDTDQQDDDSEV
jgi:hypothetical protein